MSEEQKVTTVFDWNTEAVLKGVQEIEKAYSRERSAQKQSEAAAREAEQTRNRMLAGLPGSRSSGNGGSSGGKHGGHGGGFAENLSWGVHDLSEGRTANGLFRLASAFGIAGTAMSGALLAYKAVAAYNETVGSTLNLKQAMGQGRQSFVERNPYLAAHLPAFVPRTIFDQGEAATGPLQSVSGMGQQQADILAGIEEEKRSRTLMATVVDKNTNVAFAHRSAMNDSIGAEGQGYDMLAEIDKRRAGYLNRGSAADRLSAYGSARQGALASSAAQFEQDQAEAGDANRTGKIGPAEYHARYLKAESDRQIRDKQINRENDAARRQRIEEFRDIEARGGGTHVAERIAQNRMHAAMGEMRNAPTDEARAAARTKYTAAWQEHHEAGFSWRERDARLNTEKEIADFRGASDARALFAAEEELKLQQSLLSVAKEKGADEEKAANAAVAGAQKTLDLLKEQQTVARIAYTTQLGKNSRDVYASAALLRGASPEQTQREQLVARLDDARDEHHAAHEEGDKRHWDVASKSRAAAARRSMAEAQIGLDVHDKEFARERGRELEGARGETASLRFASYGRDDLAGLASGRAQSRLAIEDANFHKNPELASELGEQQQLRERRMLTEKYLNEDGTRRNPADVQREEVANRRKQTRFDQFFRGGAVDADGGQGGLHTGGLASGNGIETAASRMLANPGIDHDPAARLARADTRFGGTALSHGPEKVGSLGLGLAGVEKGMDGQIVSARDALTGEHLNAREIAGRAHDMQARAAEHKENAKDDRSDREIQQSIFKLLEKRLPAVAV